VFRHPCASSSSDWTHGSHTVYDGGPGYFWNTLVVQKSYKVGYDLKHSIVSWYIYIGCTQKVERSWDKAACLYCKCFQETENGDELHRKKATEIQKNKRSGRATSEQWVSSISLFENCWVFRGLKQRREGEVGQGERWGYRPLNPLKWRGAGQWWGEAKTSFLHGRIRAVFSLTTHSRILLEKLTVILLVKNYPLEIFSFWHFVQWPCNIKLL